jgi:hypothetical protein
LSTGAFLVTYGIAMVLCGIPIFFQEVAIGQYLGAGGMTLVGQLCPIFKGNCHFSVPLVSFPRFKSSIIPLVLLPEMTKTHVLKVQLATCGLKHSHAKLKQLRVI